MADAIKPVESSLPGTDRGDRIAVWFRRGVMCALTAVIVVALMNVVGQRATTAQASSSQAELTVRAPKVVRPGLLFQAKISVTAKTALPGAKVVLNSGWVDGLTINTIEPSPSTENSGPDGSLVFDLGALQAGQTWVQYLEYQVNPTSISRRHQVVTVLSGTTPVIALQRTMTIVP